MRLLVIDDELTTEFSFDIELNMMFSFPNVGYTMVITSYVPSFKKQYKRLINSSYINFKQKQAHNSH
nr:hypothetical protein BCU55_17045 [Shewanella sp. 10N.286.48.A6]